MEPLDICVGSSYFLSGVMGGSGSGSSTVLGIRMESQDYRHLVSAAIQRADPTAIVIDPLAMGALRAAELTTAEPWTDDNDVRRMFGDVVAAAAAADIVISYLPTASMGSAVELHEARNAGKLIICIVPSAAMRSNWVVRSYADRTVESIEACAALLQASAT